MKNICVVTGTRAEYHLLFPLLKRLKKDPELKLTLAVTGAHLNEAYGNTYRDIERDGFFIDAKIDILQKEDKIHDINTAMSKAIEGFDVFLSKQRPDLIILLGDRYELLSVAIVAMNYQIPIAHIHGGETTEGAIDECIRHAITKMSYLHFTSCEEYRNRVIQLGENPDRVFNVGGLGVENAKNVKLMTLDELERSLDFSLKERFAVVTFHPVTLEDDTAEDDFLKLLQALEQTDHLKIIFTKANADAGGLRINSLIDAYVGKRPEQCIAVYSLGLVRYLTALKYAAIVIRNSSSGILETPSFGVPTVNIGDRQKGRIQAQNIINCQVKTEAIVNAIRKGLDEQFKDYAANAVNPYGEGHASEQIVKIIKQVLYTSNINLKKQFYNIPMNQ